MPRILMEKLELTAGEVENNKKIKKFTSLRP